MIEDILTKAEGLAGDLQPWGDYYRLRAKEMEALISMCKMGRAGKILEIGCGNGFVSAILSQFADEIVATDLSEPDTGTHSIGISKAKALFERLNVKNARVVSCSGEKLPFKNRTFDLVFCLYTLEHLKDRGMVMREVRRVLKNGSEAIFIVPSFAERALYPFVYYSEIAAKTLRLVFMKEGDDKKKSGDNGTAKRAPVSIWCRFKSSYPHFPMPDPHGEYFDYFRELVGSMPFSWIGLARKNGLRVKESFTAMLFPKALTSIFLGGMSLGLYIKTLPLNVKVGKWPFFKYFGQNLCLILEDENG